MAISSSSISTFGSLQPRGNAMSGAVNFIRGKASQSISGVKSKIGGLGSNIGEKIKNISTKPQSNVGERRNVVRDELQTFRNDNSIVNFHRQHKTSLRYLSRQHPKRHHKLVHRLRNAKFHKQYNRLRSKRLFHNRMSVKDYIIWIFHR